MYPDARPRRREEKTMSRITLRNLPVFVIGTVFVLLGVSCSAFAEENLDADRIAAASGAKATTTPDGVVRIAWARNDVPVKVDCMPLKPFAGLGSWAAFTRAPHGAMVMGDTVVF